MTELYTVDIALLKLERGFMWYLQFYLQEKQE